ncbi:MAG: hypothetical protein ACOY94_07995 [Bacillota bacterium]
MAFEIFMRAQAKWRGILVYILLQSVTHFVTRVIFYEAGDPRLRLFANLVSVATTVFCFVNIVRLVTRDSEGDEEWPRLWG